MTAERKNIKSDIDTLDRILYLLRYKQSVLIEESSDKDFEKVTDYVESLMTKLEGKCQKMPIGYRYTGTFYLKKSYPLPSESVKIKGAAFMREDLVSWVIESDDEYAKNLWYVREIFKDKDMKQRINRDEAEPVFEEKKKR